MAALIWRGIMRSRGSAQNVIRNTARDLPLAHDDAVCSKLLEIIHLGIGMGARDDI
jgi:hypothetical protein